MVCSFRWKKYVLVNILLLSVLYFLTLSFVLFYNLQETRTLTLSFTKKTESADTSSSSCSFCSNRLRSSSRSFLSLYLSRSRSFSQSARTIPIGVCKLFYIVGKNVLDDQLCNTRMTEKVTKIHFKHTQSSTFSTCSDICFF